MLLGDRRDQRSRGFPSKFAHSRKKLFWVDRDLASLRGEELSDSLLGTWAHIAETSSRSRLCRIAEG